MKKVRILITEDDPVQALMLQRALKQLGHEVIGVVSSGEAALEQCKSNSPELIMMDIGLPGGMDGITTAQLIKKRFDIPVIYVTASDDEGTIQKAVATNANGYVLKPINSREIAIVVEMALTKDMLEKRLKNLNKELDQKVKDRTKQLEKANKSLKKSLEKEKELNELKSKIVTNVSHQFKTPLTTINSSAELIDRNIELGRTTDRILKHSQRIQNSVKHLNNLLNEMLYIDKADSVKINFNPELVDIPDFLDKFIDEVKHGVCRDHKVIFQMENIPETGMFDPELFHQVLSNLATNASNYTDKGKKIHLHFSGSDDKFYARISDEGIGIPEKEQHKIYERFYRGSNVGPREGTGIGMPIVKNSIEIHKGGIEMKSTEGKGTSFLVWIPLKLSS
jgi:signal transduction histidine kinase